MTALLGAIKVVKITKVDNGYFVEVRGHRGDEGVKPTSGEYFNKRLIFKDEKEVRAYMNLLFGE